MSSASENLPIELRGLASSTLQQGGYLIAAVIYIYIVPAQSKMSPPMFRATFWWRS